MPPFRHTAHIVSSPQDKFVEAAAKGDFVTVAGMIGEGMDPNSKNRLLTPAINHAALEGHYAIIELLLDTGASPNEPDGDGYVALHRAALRNHTDVVRQLLDAGANLDARCSGSHENARDIAVKYTENYHNEDAIAVLDRYAHMPSFDPGKHYTKAELMERNPETGLALLDNPLTWQHFETLVDAMLAHGETLTKADLLKTNAEGKTWFERGTECRQFGPVLMHLHMLGEQLTPEDLIEQDRSPSPILQTIERTRNLGQLFTLDNWRGQHPQDVTETYDALSDYGKGQVQNLHTLNCVVQRHLKLSQKEQGIG